AQSLREPARRSHRFGNEISRADDLLDDRAALGGVAIEQLAVRSASHNKIEFPHKVPNILQSGIHSLASKRAVNVGRVTSNEHVPDPQSPSLSVMDSKITTPPHGQRLDSCRPALR